MTIQIEPGLVHINNHVVWTCRTLNNESWQSQLEETERRFAELLSRAVLNAEACR